MLFFKEDISREEKIVVFNNLLNSMATMNRKEISLYKRLITRKYQHKTYLLKDGEITIKIFNELFGKEHMTYDFWFNNNNFKSPHCKKGFIKYWSNYNE